MFEIYYQKLKSIEASILQKFSDNLRYNVYFKIQCDILRWNLQPGLSKLLAFSPSYWLPPSWSATFLVLNHKELAINIPLWYRYLVNTQLQRLMVTIVTSWLLYHQMITKDGYLSHLSTSGSSVNSSNVYRSRAWSFIRYAYPIKHRSNCTVTFQFVTHFCWNYNTMF